MSLNLLKYYLLILLTPSLAVVIVYFIARGALMQAQKERALRLANEAANGFERQIKEIRNVGLYITQDSDFFYKVKQVSEDLESATFYSMYTLAQSLPNYTLTNQMIESMYLLFREFDYVICPPAVIPNNEIGMKTVNRFGYDSYEQIMDSFTKEYYQGRLMNYNDGNLMIVQTYPYIKNNYYTGVIIITLKRSSIDQIMEISNFDQNGSTYILDEKGKIVCSSVSKPLKKKAEKVGIKSLSQAEFEKYLKAINLDKKTFISNTQIGNSGWKFVTVVEDKFLLRGIDTIKIISLALCFLSIFIGGMICVFYWKSNRRMIGRYYEVQYEIEYDDKKNRAHQNNFWDSLYDFLESVEQLENRQHQDAVRKLLFGKYETIDQIERDMGRKFEALVNVKGYYVIIFRFGLKDGDCFFLSESRIQEMIMLYLKKSLKITHWLHAIDNHTYAVILGDTEGLSIMELHEKIEGLIQIVTRKNMGDIYIGCSRFKDHLLKLAEGFKEAVSACKYASFFRITTPIFTALETGIELLKGPKDEIDLDQIIKGAMDKDTESEFDACLMEILEFYRERIQRFFLVEHLIERVKCSFIRCICKGSDKEQAMIPSIQLIEWPDELLGVMRTVENERLQKKAILLSRLESETMKEIDRYMRENYSDCNFNLNKLSQLIQIPEVKLYRKFKAYFDVTFTEYLEGLRMQQAKRLLKKGIDVNKVAVQVGYGSDYSFRRAFKRVTGLKPSEYMKS